MSISTFDQHPLIHVALDTLNLSHHVAHIQTSANKKLKPSER